jgi:GH25 family lysozyme M1 (1,4-beta-N-acetylmuramidase)
MSFIADMSEYQPENVDFTQLKAQVDLVILRDQFGYSKKDAKYDAYVAGCKSVGLPFDTYAFFDAASVSDAVAEAESDIHRMAKESVVAWIDIETVSVKSGQDNDLIAAANAYYDDLKKAGFQKVGLYSGEYFYNQHGLSAVKKDCLWLAKYNANDGTLDLAKRPQVACDIWQFTSVGHLNGVTGNLDLSVILGGKPLSYFTGKEVLGMKGCLDTPTPNMTVKDTVTISGWFLAESGIDRVQIDLDTTQAVAFPKCDVPRPDVQQVYPNYNEPNAGFSIQWDTSKVTQGQHTLTVIGYPKDGSDGLKLPDTIVTVEAPTPAPAPVDVTTPPYYTGGPIKAPGPLQPVGPKKYNVELPNLRGFSLGAVHEYISDKGWGYTATENKDGTLSLEVGIFSEGSSSLAAFEAYLDTEKYAYTVKETTV